MDDGKLDSDYERTRQADVVSPRTERNRFEYRRNNLSRTIPILFSSSVKKAHWHIPSCSRDDWHDDSAPFLFSPDINYAFVSSSRGTSSIDRSIDRTVPGQRRQRRRRRRRRCRREGEGGATVKNDGTLRREETRAFIVFRTVRLLDFTTRPSPPPRFEARCIPLLDRVRNISRGIFISRNYTRV